ncbi:MAG: hypothetical protein IT381_30340 [Deltaproteobacteria bacterium]|nr:hypothetical protein [Deltaproteobacteria bacterium]
MRPWLTFLVVLLSARAAVAGDRWVNPGSMGANALPTIAAEPPWTVEYTQVTVGVAYQQGKLDDHSFVPTFRLAAPFGKHVTAIFDGQPIELWWASPRTEVAWQLPRSHGVSKADIRFGVKLLLVDFGQNKPKIAFRGLTKTTTGKDYDARRFTDAPGYLLEVIIGQRFLPNERFLVDLYLSGGYWIWQQGADLQNDAIHVALALDLRVHERLQLGWQFRGFFGWQKKEDRPLVASLRVGVDVAPFLQLSTTVNLGFLDAPKVDLRFDLTFRLPALVPLIL